MLKNRLKLGIETLKVGIETLKKFTILERNDHLRNPVLRAQKLLEKIHAFSE